MRKHLKIQSIRSIKYNTFDKDCVSLHYALPLSCVHGATVAGRVYSFSRRACLRGIAPPRFHDFLLCETRRRRPPSKNHNNSKITVNNKK